MRPCLRELNDLISHAMHIATLETRWLVPAALQIEANAPVLTEILQTLANLGFTTHMAEGQSLMSGKVPMLVISWTANVAAPPVAAKKIEEDSDAFV